jgi:hypothetical protein
LFVGIEMWTGVLADALPARSRRVAVERCREEDRAALRVEVEDFRRIGREAEAVIGRPRADLGGATLEHRDVQGIDLDLHQHFGAARGSRRRESREVRLGNGVRLTDKPLERPVAALLDARRYSGERRQAAERASATSELEGRHVMLDPVVITRERRRPQEIDRPIRSDEPAAG